MLTHSHKEPTMNARDVLEKAVKIARGDIPNKWARLSDRDKDSAELGVRRVIAAGFTIMSKEDVEAVREKALEEAATMLDDGSYTMLVSEPWRDDGQPSKHDKCKHGATMYEDCIECAAA